MAKYLVIVESPAKVKTIKKFLGANYEVAASQGHVRDLPRSVLGIDVDHDFEPKYITIRGKGDILANLRKEVKKAEKVYLATDPDREGEAISWHLLFALKLENKKVYRITFNEITKTAVKESLKNAREINMDLVDAQQARRCLGVLPHQEDLPVLKNGGPGVQLGGLVACLAAEEVPGLFQGDVCLKAYHLRGDVTNARIPLPSIGVGSIVQARLGHSLELHRPVKPGVCPVHGDSSLRSVRLPHCGRTVFC